MVQTIYRRYSLGGFSLVELMIAIAIVALLAAIAHPSYQESVRKAKRAEGRAALMQLMQQQERYYSQNSSYIAFSRSAVDPKEKQFKWYSGDTAQKSAYEISGSACQDEVIDNCVALTAEPGTANVDFHYKDPKCGQLVLFSTGRKAADANDCW